MRSSLITALLAGLGACDSGEDIGEVTSAVESPNALSLNALSLNALSLNALSLNALSLNGLDGDSAIACSTPEGRSVLRYVVACALPQGTSLSCPDHPDVFHGRIGLAPQWASGGLDLVGRRWVSACLLAHVNNFQVPIQISLAGNHPALVRDPEEQEEFPYKEAAFYGDLFSLELPPVTSDGIRSGTLGRVSCQNEVAGWPVKDWYLKMRVCAKPNRPGWTACNFADGGRCRPPSGQSTSACTLAVGETDEQCAGGQIYPGWEEIEGKDGLDRHLLINRQTITVFMRASAAHDLCSEACQEAVGQGWLAPWECDNCPAAEDQFQGGSGGSGS